jgi:hypothetical protein
MKISLKDILPNPHRDLKFNPLNEAKVAELVNSITDTGFWDNVVVRKNKAAKYELAYGHHRVEAAKRAGLESADFIVKNLDDAKMLQIMARENREVYKSNIVSLLENVRAVVFALAEGRIPPFEVDPKTNGSVIRCAPSFIPGTSDASKSSHRYTVANIGKFLGYTKQSRSGESTTASNAVQAALGVLHLQEIGRLENTRIEDMTIAELLEFVRGTLKRVMEQRVQNAQTRQEQNKVVAEKLAFEEEGKSRMKELQTQREKVKREEEEAQARKDEQEARQLAERRRQLEEDEKQEQKKLKQERPKFDAKMRKIAADAEEKAEKQRKLTLVSQHVDAVLFKLQTIPSERNAFRDELKNLLRLDLDVNQRELVRQGLEAAGTWYSEQAINFLPASPRKTDVLAEAHKKEEMARKRKGENA